MTAQDDICTEQLRKLLLFQFQTAWALTAYHLDGLTTEECLWRPAVRGLHVHADGAGGWRADWPEDESYNIGPPSIAWTSWHICFWWRKTLDHLRGDTALSPEAVAWPGSAERVRVELQEMHDKWREIIGRGDDLQAARAESWPLPEASLARTAAWLNLELMKNAAEIGLVRFLYAVRNGDARTGH